VRAVQPREIPFTAARRAVITAIRPERAGQGGMGGQPGC
jgi:hypothetical protein